MSKKRVMCGSGAELIAFAEDEYLSEVMLPALTKPSKKVPKSVTFEWGLVIPGDGAAKFQSYMVTATGVTKWSLDGAWSKTHVIEMDFAPTKKRIAMTQTIPGVLALECASLSIERGGLKRYTLPPRILADRFLVFGAREVTWTELRQWLAVPDELDMYDQTSVDTLIDHAKDDEVIKSPCFGLHKFQTAAGVEAPWISVAMMLAITTKGHYFSVHRGTCDDAAWEHAKQLPAQLGPCEVMSGTVRCTGEEWIAKWASGGQTSTTKPGRVVAPTKKQRPRARAAAPKKAIRRPRPESASAPSRPSGARAASPTRATRGPRPGSASAPSRRSGARSASPARSTKRARKTSTSRAGRARS